MTLNTTRVEASTASLDNLFQCLNAADVIEASRKQQHTQSYFSKLGSPESLLSKDPLYQKIAKFALSDKVAGAEIHREAIAVSGEQTGLYISVHTSMISLFLTVGDTVGPRWTQELPLESGATAFAIAVLKADMWTVQGV